MNRNFWYILAVGILLILICGLMMQSASAYIVPPANETIVIVNQGDTVYWNHWYDIRSLSPWPNPEVAYFNVYSKYDYGYCSGTPNKTVNVLEYQAKFYIDPAIFTPGTWFKWGTEKCEPAENQVAFIVSEKPVPIIIENKTIIVIENVTAVPTTPSYPKIPVKHISDLLVARGDPVSFTNEAIKDGSHVWILGRESIKEYENLLDIHSDNGVLNIPTADIQNLNPHEYTILVDNPGTNTITEAEYNQANQEIRSPFYKTPEINAAGYSGSVLLDKLLPWFRQYSDDSITVLEMSVQDPMVEIRTIDEMWVNSTSVLDVQAYTNVAEGTIATAYLDYNPDDHSVHIKSWATTVTGDDHGDMRTILATVPIDWENINPGEHSITIIVPQGKAFSTVPFHVYSLPEGQKKPLMHTLYAGGDEFKPVVTVTVPVPGPTRIVTQIVTVQLTPDYDTLAKAQNDKWWITFIQIAETILMWGFIVLAVGSFIAYIAWIYFRGKKNKGIY